MASKNKSSNKSLYDKLKLEKKSAWLKLNERKIFDFSEKYKDFLKKSKTERESIKNIIEIPQLFIQ